MSGRMRNPRYKFNQRRYKTFRSTKPWNKGQSTPYTKSAYSKKRRAQRGYLRKVGTYGRYKNTPDGEEKYFQAGLRDIQTDISSATPQIIPTLNLIPQGNGPGDRIGRKCTITAININFVTQLKPIPNGSSTVDTENAFRDSSRVYRIIVYQDKQCNGTAATGDNILDLVNTNSDPASQYIAVQSFRNLENSKRFRILMDKKCTISSLGGIGNRGTPSYLPRLQQFSMNTKCKIPITFDAADPSIANIQSNNIGMLLVGSPELGSNTSSVNLNVFWNARIRFVG